MSQIFYGMSQNVTDILRNVFLLKWVCTIRQFEVKYSEIRSQIPRNPFKYCEIRPRIVESVQYLRNQTRYRQIRLNTAESVKNPKPRKALLEVIYSLKKRHRTEPAVKNEESVQPPRNPFKFHGIRSTTTESVFKYHRFHSKHRGNRLHITQ